ncbi:MAG: hypothetical protein LBI63_05400 [Candidatus Ancillula sp.]|jgi:hypothetical protein|nr:hypothetical protein [Candidatus Ancillula sp.]
MNLKRFKFVPAYHFLIVVISVIIIVEVYDRHFSVVSSNYQVISHVYSLNGKVLTKENLNSSLLDFPVAVSLPICSNERLAWTGADRFQAVVNGACPRAVGIQLQNRYTDIFANLRSLSTRMDQDVDSTSSVHYYSRFGPSLLPDTAFIARNRSYIDGKKLDIDSAHANVSDVEIQRRKTVVDKFGVGSSGATVDFGENSVENSGQGKRTLHYNSGFELADEKVVVEYENVGNYYYLVGSGDKVNVAPLSARITISDIKATKQGKNTPKMVFSNNLLSGFYLEQIESFNFKLEFVAKHLYGSSFTITDETSSKANSGKVLDTVFDNTNLTCSNNLCKINYTPYTYEYPSKNQAKFNLGEHWPLLLDMDLSVVDEETSNQLSDAGDFEIKKCKTDPNLNSTPLKFSSIAGMCDDVYLDFKANTADKLLKIKNLPVDTVQTYYILRNKKHIDNYEDSSNSYYLITLQADFTSNTIDPYIYYYDFTTLGNFNVVKSGVLTENGPVNEIESGDSFVYDALARKITMNTSLVQRSMNMRINVGVDCTSVVNKPDCNEDNMYITIWKSDPSGSLSNYKFGPSAGISVDLGMTSSDENICYNSGEFNGQLHVDEYMSALCKTQGVGIGKKMHVAQFDALPVGWYVIKWGKKLYFVYLSRNSGRIISSDFDGEKNIWQCTQKSADDFELDKSCGTSFTGMYDNTVEFSLIF